MDERNISELESALLCKWYTDLKKRDENMIQSALEGYFAVLVYAGFKVF